MKLLKKMISLLCVFAMAFSMTTNVFAAAPTNSVTIEVDGIVQETGTTVTAYKIVEVSNTTTNGWAAVSGLETYIANVTNPTTSELTTLTTLIGNGTITGLESVTMITDGTTYLSGADTVANYTASVTSAGMYLIVVSGGTGTVEYNPMAVTVTISEVDGVLTNVAGDKSKITAKHSTTTIEKIASSSPTSHTADEQTAAKSLAVGDTVYFTVTTRIPQYETGTTGVTFVITDTLDSGLTYTVNSASVSVNNVSTGFESYIDTATAQQIKVDLSTIAVDHAGETVVLTYAATLNSNAVTGFNANENNVELQYTKDGSIETAEDYTYHYTFEIDGNITGSTYTNEVIKVGENEYKTVSGQTVVNALEGAEFMLYTDQACTTKVAFAPSDGSNYTSDSNGRIYIKGLDAGVDYYLKEVVAPDGYTLNPTVYKIRIEASYTGKELTDYTVTITNMSDDTQVNTCSYTSDGTNVNTTREETTYIKNTTVAELPSTGGMGTMIFTIAGCSLMIIAAAAFLASRKRKVEEE